MGLDNMPMAYPCRTEGTAIMTGADGDTIDCNETIAAGRCPWHRDLGETEGVVRGAVFGTGCWYRGKVANWWLDALAAEGEESPLTFYGTAHDDDGQHGEGEYLDSEQCRTLARWMADRAELFARITHRDYAIEVAERQPADWVGREPVDVDVMTREEVGRYRYAVRWLKWTAEHGGGSAVWY